MDKNIEAYKRMNEILNQLTERRTRGNAEYDAFPICIFWKNFSDELMEYFRTEISSKFNACINVPWDAVRCVAMKNFADLKTAVTTAVSKLQEKIETGEVMRIRRLYIPMFLMTDCMDITELKQAIEQLEILMRLYGYENAYEVAIYSIFDYEKMDGNALKDMLNKFCRENPSKVKIGIFTQEHMAASTLGKYFQVIQAITMHIFLKCIMPQGAWECRHDYYTLVYEKRDLIKWKAIEYMLYLLDATENTSNAKEDYEEKIEKQIEEEISEKIDLFAFGEAIRVMPVKKEKVTRGNYRFRELLCEMYGNERVFSKFIENSTAPIDFYWAEEFMRKNIGNLRDITEFLISILEKLENHYQNEAENKRRELEKQLDVNTRVSYGDDLTALIDRIEKNIWGEEGEWYCLQRKAELTETVIHYIEGDIFRNIIKEIQETVKTNKICLERIKKNMLFSHIKDEEGKYRKKSLLKWDNDIFSPESLNEIKEEIKKYRDRLEQQFNEDNLGIVAAFANDLKEERNIKGGSGFFKARLDNGGTAETRMTLFIGDNYERCEDSRLNQSVNLHVNAEVKRCSWEPAFCMEFFAVQEIEDLSEVYAID